MARDSKNVEILQTKIISEARESWMTPLRHLSATLLVDSKKTSSKASKINEPLEH